MVQEFDVVVTGLRGQKAIEIEGPTGSVPWALGLEATDDDDEAFQQVVEDVAAILSDQIADAGRSLDSIPSGTTAGTLQVNNIGAWEFTPDLPERQFGDLQPQTGGQATFGDDDDPLDASRQATEEAKEQIRSRIQMNHFTDEDGMVEKWIIEDPATDYRVKVQMSARDLVRHEPRPGGDLPPAVQQRIDSFPDQLLREVEQRTDTQHCWV